ANSSRAIRARTRSGRRPVSRAHQAPLTPKPSNGAPPADDAAAVPVGALSLSAIAGGSISSIASSATIASRAVRGGQRRVNVIRARDRGALVLRTVPEGGHTLTSAAARGNVPGSQLRQRGLNRVWLALHPWSAMTARHGGRERHPD